MYTAAGPSGTRRSPFSDPLETEWTRGVRLRPSLSIPDMHPSLATWSHPAGRPWLERLQGGGWGRLRELLPGPCCALIGHGEIDGISPPRSPPRAQDGSGWTCHLASLSGSPGPIGHQCGMSPDRKLELRVRRACARVFARACVFSERRSFSELDSSPPECPDGADNAAPQGQWRVPRSRWRGVSVRRWTRG